MKNPATSDRTKNVQSKRNYMQGFHKKQKHRVKRPRSTFTLSDFKEVELAAEESGMRPATFIREATLACIKNRRIVPRSTETKLQALIILLRNIGNSLNQIAQRTNIAKRIGVFDLLKAKKRVHSLEGIIRNFICESLSPNDYKINDSENGELQSTFRIHKQARKKGRASSSTQLHSRPGSPEKN